MSDRLRVLAVDQGPGIWGAQAYLLGLRPLLAHRSIDVVLGAPAALAQSVEWRRRRLPTVPIDLPTSRSVRGRHGPSTRRIYSEMRASRRSVLALRDAVKSGDFDLVLANAHWTHLDVAVAGRLVGIPVMLLLHEVTEFGLGAAQRGAAIRIATRAVAVSSGVASAVPPWARRRVSVIPNAVDTEVFAPGTAADLRRALTESFGVPHDHSLILAATRLDPDKRIEDLVALSTRLKCATVLVAGAPSDSDSYSSRLIHDALERSAPIKFLGARDDVPRLMRAVDVFVHCGVREGMSLGLIEAQASGLPAVVYRTSGVDEVLREGTSGYAVDPGDLVGLAAAVQRLADDPSLRSAFGAVARQEMTRAHSLSDQADRLAALMYSAAGRHET